MNKAETLELRRKHISNALSLSYSEPLKIVRGEGATLFDESGRRFLDCVNNVSHVGHCHPRVVEAAARQMALLNTNTRYLHDELPLYASRLTALVPDPLDVCFFVCTGSEANDLALRLARTKTKRRDVAVIDGAYHGNAGSLIELSPYKFDGPGGSGCADHVHVARMPDPYRAGADAGTCASDLERIASEHSIAAFFCESLLGCGGQIVLPRGYMSEAFGHVRGAGGVCIADEVQVGFGRVGTHFWGFETQEVVPDIVTLGKPIGNGHPLAAVITTREIADAFDDGMEYFNTFGGNPVSCAIGLAVLDVIEEEGLQENARVVGAHLKARLEELAPKCELIGDVRGLGLFLGVELVRDHETLEPAADEASAIVEAMKNEGVLLSTDGPLHNVIKIKPPIVFSRDDADQLADTLTDVLAKLA